MKTPKMPKSKLTKSKFSFRKVVTVSISLLILVTDVLLEEFIDGSLEVWCQGRDMVILFQAAQFVDIHLDLVFLACLLELLLVDVVATYRVGLQQDYIVLVGPIEMARYKYLFHHQIINAGFAILINVIYLIESMIGI